jgi:hypothetical protein
MAVFARSLVGAVAVAMGCLRITGMMALSMHGATAMDVTQFVVTAVGAVETAAPTLAAVATATVAVVAAAMLKVISMRVAVGL